MAETIKAIRYLPEFTSLGYPIPVQSK